MKRLHEDRPYGRRGTRVPAALLLLTCLLVPAAGTGSARAADRTPLVYRLDDTSSFQRGCFPPCLCPLMEKGALQGTFVLTRSGSDGLYDYYNVSEVNFTARLQASELRIIGSGVYKVGGGFARQQQLTLDLKVGDEPFQRFDSGLVPGSGFPRIDATVSQHGKVCFDTAIEIHSARVPPTEIHPYLALPGSTLRRECAPSCTCPPAVQGPVSGTFTLVDLEPGPLSNEFAVVHVNLTASLAAGTRAAGVPVVGFGSYRVGGEMGAQQEMSLDLKVGNEGTARFESGRIPGGNQFPVIALPVSSESPCQNTVLDLRAAPAAPVFSPLPIFPGLRRRP